MILIRAEPGLREALKALAARDGVSAAELARAALRAALKAGAGRDGPSAETGR
jgi:plasmid stability protein